MAVRSKREVVSESNEPLKFGDARIDLYDDNSGLSAARAYFTLDELGHGERAALLDGDLLKLINCSFELFIDLGSNRIEDWVTADN